MRRSKAEVERYIASVQGSAPSPREVSKSGQGRRHGSRRPRLRLERRRPRAAWRGAAEPRRRGGDRGRLRFLFVAGRGPAPACFPRSRRDRAGLGRAVRGLVRQAPPVSGMAPILRRRRRLPGRLTPLGGGLFTVVWGGGSVDVERTNSHIREGASAQITRKALNSSLPLLCPTLYIPFPKPLLEAAILGSLKVFFLI